MTRTLLAICIGAVLFAPRLTDLGANVYLPGDYTAPYGVISEFVSMLKVGDTYQFANTVPTPGCLWKTTDSVMYC